MTYKIKNRPLATKEFFEHFDWYESQREGLGLEFLDEVENFYAILLLNPETFSFYYDNIRQGRLQKFPYTVIYELIGNEIIIYSIFMQKQNPDKKGLNSCHIRQLFI